MNEKQPFAESVLQKPFFWMIIAISSLSTFAFYATYGTVAVLSLVFQGGLALYYRSRTARVTAALAAPPAAGMPD